MRSSSRFIPGEKLGEASPFRLDSLGGDGRRSADPQVVPRQAVDQAYLRGLAEGESRARELVARERAAVQAILAGHERELARLNDDLGRAAIGLAVALAGHVVRRQLAVDTKAILPLVRDALALLNEAATPARLRLHPADADLVRQEIGTDLAQRGCQVVADAAIGRGECRIEGVHAEIDATLAARWQQALAPLGADDAWLA